MATKQPPQRIYEFADFRIDGHKRLLSKQGQALALPPKAFDILLLLLEQSLEHPGEVVEKETLLSSIWRNQIVEEANLTVHISALRKVLGESRENPRLIVTLPGRGYLFIGEARVAPPLENASPSPLASEPQQQPDTEAKSSGVSASWQDASGEVPAVRRRRGGKSVWLISVALLLVALTALVYFWQQARRATPVESVAVLPFLLLSAPAGGEHPDEYLGVMIADDVITRLSSTRRLVVRPTSAVLRYHAENQNPMHVGRELEVEAVLTGSVRRVEDRIRLNAQLLRVSDGASLWAQSFDEKFTDIPFVVHDRLCRQLAEALTLELNGVEQERLVKHYTENAEAYALYLKAKYHWQKRTREGLETCIDYLQEALRQDPRYALAHAGLAAAYAAQSIFGFAPATQAMPAAAAAAQQALALDETLESAHTALAIVNAHYHWDLPAAEANLRRALELNPNFPEAHQYYAVFLAAMGRVAEARSHIETALQLDAHSPTAPASLLWILYLSGQYDETIARGNGFLAANPQVYLFHQYLGNACLAKGDYATAIAAFERARILSSNAPVTVALLAYANAVAGKPAIARQLLEELQKQGARAQNVALIYIGLQERQEAFVWLEKAFEERAAEMIYLRTDSLYAPLRADSRFTALLGRVRFSS